MSLLHSVGGEHLATTPSVPAQRGSRARRGRGADGAAAGGPQRPAGRAKKGPRNPGADARRRAKAGPRRTSGSRREEESDKRVLEQARVPVFRESSTEVLAGLTLDSRPQRKPRLRVSQGLSDDPLPTQTFGSTTEESASASRRGCRTNQTGCTNDTRAVLADLARTAQAARAGPPRSEMVHPRIVTLCQTHKKSTTTLVCPTATALSDSVDLDGGAPALVAMR
jgi:hypothetical protein